MFVFHRVESWQCSILIPALLFLTPVQNDPLSIARRAGPAQTCLGSKPRSTGEGVWSQHSYAPHPTPFPPLPCFHPNPSPAPSTSHPLPFRRILPAPPPPPLLFFTSEGKSLEGDANRQAYRLALASQQKHVADCVR